MDHFIPVYRQSVADREGELSVGSYTLEAIPPPKAPASIQDDKRVLRSSPITSLDGQNYGIDMIIWPSPVTDIDELNYAIEQSGTTPTEIRISNDIIHDATTGDMKRVNIGMGKTIRLTSDGGAPFYTLQVISDDSHRVDTIMLGEGATLYLNNITIKNTVRACIASYGGTLLLEEGALLEGSNNDQIEAYAIMSGFGYYSIPGQVVYSTVIMSGDSRITGFASEHIPAVFMVRGSTFIMTDDAVIDNCQTNAYGGALLLGTMHVNYDVDMPTSFQPQRATITGNARISNCHAMNGGAIYAFSGEFPDYGIAYTQNELTISGSAAITGCTADNFGGGLYVTNSAVMIDSSASIDHNQAGDGGGVYVMDGYGYEASLFLGGSAKIEYNTAEDSGGGVYTPGTNFTFANDAAVSFRHNEAIAGEGGAIFTKITPNPGLVIPANVVFSDNKAATRVDYPSDETLEVMRNNVFTTHFTDGFEYVYNNYDINAVPNDSSEPPEPPKPVEGGLRARVQLCGACLCEGMFTVGLYDADGKLVGEAANDASGYAQFAGVSVTDQSSPCYTMRMKSATRKGIWLDCMPQKVVIRIDARTGKLKVGYPFGLPMFLNVASCC